MIVAVILFLVLCTITGLVISEIVEECGAPKMLLMGFLLFLSAIACQYAWAMIHA